MTTPSLVFDRPRGIVAVNGPDAASFLNNISTNDIANLRPGHWCETFFCDHRAKALFHANAWRSGDSVLLDVEPAYGAKLLAHLDKYLISEAVELEDRTGVDAFLHCAGADAEAVVIGLAGVRVNALLGVPGFDILLKANEKAAIIERLTSLGATLGDEALFETLRIEAGTPVYGKDIDETRFVMEVANAARAVCYTKGCFIGQEPIVMSRDRAGGVNRLFLGLKALEGGPLAPGTKLTRDGVEVGIITSSTISPRLGAPLALGYVRRPHVEKGLILQAGTQSLEVLGYPPLEPR